MGWKALTTKYGIRHQVQVTSDGICIGSGYVSDILTIDPETGSIRESPAFSGFLREHYPALMKADAADIVSLASAADAFASSVVVYNYEDGEIIESLCETPGWPNVTHDGRMMYENSYSTDRSKVVAWAKQGAAMAIEHTRERIAEAEAEVTKLRGRLAGHEAAQAKLLDLAP